jgi:hypothetical protein
MGTSNSGPPGFSSAAIFDIAKSAGLKVAPAEFTRVSISVAVSMSRFPVSSMTPT